MAHANYDRDANATTCAPGRGLTGAFCLLCTNRSTHYYDASEPGCKPCMDRTAALLSIALAVTILVLALAIASVALLQCRGYVWRSIRALTIHLARISLRAKARIAISFFQVHGCVPGTAGGA